MTTWITTCDTCKMDDWNDRETTKTDGESFAEMIEIAAAGQTDVRTRRVSCLMGCKNACNVAVQAKGKLNYTLGAFVPTEDAAKAIVTYAAAHAQSDTGRMPFREWPQAIKGHFVTRHPPLPDDA